jgi:hypothetical protein
MENKKISELRHEWMLKRKARDPQAEELWKEMRGLDDAFDKKTEEMITRLMKIRLSLWT